MIIFGTQLNFNLNKSAMKKCLLLFAAVLVMFSCGKEDVVSDPSTEELNDFLIENRNSDIGCSVTFLGYDENGCCLYRLNQISILGDSKDRKSTSYSEIN